MNERLRKETIDCLRAIGQTVKNDSTLEELKKIYERIQRQNVYRAIGINSIGH